MDRRQFGKLLLLTVAGCAGCGAQANQAGTAAKLPDLVLYEKPIFAPVTDYADFPGRTEAVYSVDVRARVSGYLDRVYFKDGQSVSDHDVLFQIDPRPFQADLDMAKATLDQAEAHAQRLRNEFARAKTLYDRGLSISREEYDRYSFDRAEADAALATAKARYDRANLDVKFTRVEAPLGGRLGRRLADPGNLVKADETSLVTIVSQDPIYVYFTVDEQTVLQIRRMILGGKLKAKSENEVPVKIALADVEEFAYEGFVDFTDNRVDRETGTLVFRAKLDNPKGVLTPGLFVRVQLQKGDPHTALMIRELSITSDQGQKKVFVLHRALTKDGTPDVCRDPAKNPIKDKDGKPIPKYNPTAVDVGTPGVLLPNGFREVSQGVKPDDLVVVSGLQKIRKGEAVRVRELDSTRDVLDGSKLANGSTSAPSTPKSVPTRPNQPEGPAGTSAPPASGKTTEPEARPGGRIDAAKARSFSSESSPPTGAFGAEVRSGNTRDNQGK